jgi:DNA-binding transcriptional LysR family regulator
MGADDELDWNDLRYFLRAAQAGTLAGAARAMNVDHSTIGRRLSALERALGAPLMIRAPDGLHLTPLGASLVPLVEDVERAVLAVHGRASQRHARVRLAMPTGFTKLFSANLERLRKAHPQLTLELLTGSRPVDLKRGEADLAIRSGPIADQELIARSLGEAGWSLYAAPAYLQRHPAPTDLDDLSGHDVIGFDPSLSAVPAAQWIEQRVKNAPRGARVALRSREMSDMQAAALSGAGLAMLPCLSADDEPGLVRLTPHVLATRQLALVYPREARLSQPVQAVIRFVLDVMRDNAARIAGTQQHAP